MEYIFDFKNKKAKKNSNVVIKKFRDINKAFEIHKNSNSINFEFYNPSQEEIKSLQGVCILLIMIVKK
ncbi:MAG: hypothetical protein GXN99_01230 [Candidatus Nanohaloarchaeota archaeon]|nr:hypothetical protein [Candidatus Nanohaloarchaeota archaeon]